MKFDLQDILKSDIKVLEKELSLSDNSILAEHRNQAFESLQKLGLPTTKHEDWKYCNLSTATKKSYSLATETSLTNTDLAQFNIADLGEANILTFVNGVYQSSLSTIVSPSTELTISNLKDALAIEPNLLSNNLFKYANYETDAYTALSTALAENGTFINVPNGKAVEKPILIRYISDVRSVDTFAQARNLFLVGKNAQATVIEIYHTIGAHQSFNNIVTEIALSENAILTNYKLQDESNAAYQVNTTQVNLLKESVYSAVTITLGGGVVRNNLNTVLNAERTEANLYGLFMPQGETLIDNHTIVDHAMPNCNSNELYKGVLSDNSTGVFNGKIFVRKDAQKTNAFQSNKTILLSDNATINTKPQLEIFADDVKCSHGATSGQLDEEALFYLRSRGLSEQSAKSLLVYAFATDILEKINNEALKSHLEKLIATRLNTEA